MRQHGGKTGHHIHRRADFVAHGRQEAALGLVGGLGAFLGQHQLDALLGIFAQQALLGEGGDHDGRQQVEIGLVDILDRIIGGAFFEGFQSDAFVTPGGQDNGGRHHGQLGQPV